MNITKKDTSNEYMVRAKDGGYLGDICYYKKWDKWVFYPDDMVFEKEIWFDAVCLCELAGFMETL